MVGSIWRLFSLHRDQADNEVIDAAIRGNSRVAGTNLWVLMFAIVIASVGLNVNSTAVIIGAMLISPLMGPIIAIGYGAGVHDYALIRQSFRNLALFVSISLLASTTYFLLTPLTEAHSELLARTSPTLWDVLIAFFGGAAGMVGLTRREKSTLIPGVAIATALMPPLCTAGYGIATGQPAFFLGAFHLFLINGVFIALASLAIVRILRLPRHAMPDEGARLRGRLIIALAVAGTLVPAIYLAYQLVHEEIFSANATRFVRATFQKHEDLTLLHHDIDAKARTITLTVIGKDADMPTADSWHEELAAMGLPNATLKIRHPSENRVNVSGLKQELTREILHSTALTTQQNTARLAELEARLGLQKANAIELGAVEREIQAQMPALRKVLVTTSPSGATDDKGRQTVLVAIEPAGRLAPSEHDRLVRWLKVRMPDADIRLVVGRIAS